MNNTAAKIYKETYEKVLGGKDKFFQRAVKEGGSAANRRALDLFIEEVLNEAEEAFKRVEGASE